jgi:hypothetical protein
MIWTWFKDEWLITRQAAKLFFTHPYTGIRTRRSRLEDRYRENVLLASGSICDLFCSVADSNLLSMVWDVAVLGANRSRQQKRHANVVCYFTGRFLVGELLVLSFRISSADI